MNTPTATTCSAHRWSHRGRLRGHTSKNAKAVVPDRPRTMVRRKSEDGELFHLVINRRATPIDIVSATATRRDVFAIMPVGLAAVATSDMTPRIPVRGYGSARLATKEGFAETNGGYIR